MPISAVTPGEHRKSAVRSQQPPLVAGRPVTEATTKLRQRYWQSFLDWTAEEGIDFGEILADAQHCVGEINIVMTRFWTGSSHTGQVLQSVCRDPKFSWDHKTWDTQTASTELGIWDMLGRAVNHPITM